MVKEELVEILIREVLKEIRKVDSTEGDKGMSDPAGRPGIAFLGNDVILRDELVNSGLDIEDAKEGAGQSGQGNMYGKKLVVAFLGINDMIDLAQGRKGIITEHLLSDGEVLIIEEGLEYRRYKSPLALIKTYDGYIKAIVNMGIRIIRRAEAAEILKVRQELTIQGAVTLEKLKAVNARNQRIKVAKAGIVTAAAWDYIKEHGIQIYYEGRQ